MATVKPFCAVRPGAGLDSIISALPYDVYNRAEAKEYISAHPASFLKIDRPESQFSDDTDTYDPRVYVKAREMYTEYLNTGKFVKDKKPSFYLYEQTMNGRSQTGLVCCTSVDEYDNGIIKKHENTRADKELDRINHVDKVDAQTGPIFLAYRGVDELNRFFASFKAAHSPYCDFVSEDGIGHKCFEINDDADIDYIINTFDKIPNLYIADGHHRCASACKVSKMRRKASQNNDSSAEYNYFLSVIFPDNELMIMDYNRVLKSLNGLSDSEFMARVSENFTVTAKPQNDDKPSKKGDFYMYFKGCEYVLNLKHALQESSPVDLLDVSILQKYLLEPVLGIKDPKTDSRIDFVGGIRGVKELKRRLSTDAVVAFSMYPTQMTELFAVADAGLLMPPKSTWFEPKLRSGLFIHELS